MPAIWDAPSPRRAKGHMGWENLESVTVTSFTSISLLTWFFLPNDLQFSQGLPASTTNKPFPAMPGCSDVMHLRSPTVCPVFPHCVYQCCICSTDRESLNKTLEGTHRSYHSADLPAMALTSTYEADGTEESCFSVIHLERQQLVSKGKDQVCERAKACIVHLSAVERQAVWEGHGILFWGIACTYPQDLGKGQASWDKFALQWLRWVIPPPKGKNYLFSISISPRDFFKRWRRTQTHQNIEAGSFEKRDLVSDGESGETRQLLGKFYCLDDTLCGQFTKLVPQVNVERDPLIWAVVLWRGEGVGSKKEKRVRPRALIHT